MAIPILVDFLGYRITVEFWVDSAKTRKILPPHPATDWALSEMCHDERGLRLLQGHMAGRPLLYRQLHEARYLEAIIRDGSDKHYREMHYMISGPVPITLIADAYADRVALNGVLFRNAALLTLVDGEEQPEPST